jgi:hypothetical protein
MLSSTGTRAHTGNVTPRGREDVNTIVILDALRGILRETIELIGEVFERVSVCPEAPGALMNEGVSESKVGPGGDRTFK